jgi:CheY-like chemotaxis protein
MSKIFIVDDDPLMVRMYAKKLTNDGYTVETAGDGAEAIKKLESYTPDLILLDIMMPELNGLEVLKTLKSKPATEKIPVILLTNVGSSDEDVERGLELGAVAYLTKAGNKPADVVSKIKEILAGYVREIPQVKKPQ